MLSFKEYSEYDEPTVDEEISIQTRLKKKQSIRRYKAKLKLGRLRASRRVASKEVIKKRAMRAARAFMFKRLVKGKSKSDLAYSARGTFEKIINRRKAAISKIAQRLQPKIRRAEMQRKLGKKTNVTGASR
jgi:hypothetical protein